MHLERIRESQVSKKEFKFYVAVSEILDKKIKHIALMQLETAKTLIPKLAHQTSFINAHETV